MISRPRLEYAAEAFLQRLRSGQSSLKPAETVEPRKLSDYSPEHRSILMNALAAALVASGPEADRQFNDWLARKNVDA